MKKIKEPEKLKIKKVADQSLVQEKGKGKVYDKYVLLFTLFIKIKLLFYPTVSMPQEVVSYYCHKIKFALLPIYYA